MNSSKDKVADNKTSPGVFLSLLSWVLYGLIRGYLASLRKSYVNSGPYRERYDKEEGMLIAFWHNQMLTMPFLYFGKPFQISTLVSLSKDGELTTQILRRWGIGAVRGSSTRGGSAAFKELLRLAKNPGHHLVLAPDGPTGPPFYVKDGLLLLAHRTGRPIQPLAVSFQRYFQLKSWDGFLVPYPFTKAYFVCGDPVQMPPDLDETTIEEARLALTKALQDTNALAVSLRTPKKGF